MIATLIVPGVNGSPEGHWQRHWAEDDARADIVEQEDWSRPVLADWLHTLEARIEGCAPGVILVAHSLGCSLVAALAGRPVASHVGGALLVAPADVATLAEDYSTALPFAAASAASLPFASILVASRNDPFMRFGDAKRQAATWGSALYDLGQAGHVNIASGFGPWPDAATLAEGLRGRAYTLSEDPRSQSGWRQVRPLSARMHDAGLGVQ